MKFTTALLALVASVGFAAASPTEKESTPAAYSPPPPTYTTICNDYPTCSAVYKTKTKSWEKPTTKYYYTTLTKHVTQTTEVPTTVYSTYTKENTKYSTEAKYKTIKKPEIKYTHTQVCYDKPTRYTTYKEYTKTYTVTVPYTYTKTKTQEYPTTYYSTYTTETPYPEKTSKVETETKYKTYVKTEKDCTKEHKCTTSMMY